MYVCMFGSGAVCMLDRCLRLDVDVDGDADVDAGLRVGAGLWCCWRDGVVSASAVVALRAAKRLWRNTKAMRG